MGARDAGSGTQKWCSSVIIIIFEFERLIEPMGGAGCMMCFLEGSPTECVGSSSW